MSRRYTRGPRRVALLAQATGALVAAAAAASHASAAAPAKAVLVGSGFAAPMYITAPANDARLVVAERGGTIRTLNSLGGAASTNPILTIPSVATDGERGLLGLAFDPNFAT